MPQNFPTEIWRPSEWAVWPGTGETAAQGVFKGARLRGNRLRHEGGAGAHVGVGDSPGDRIDRRVHRLLIEGAGRLRHSRMKRGKAGMDRGGRKSQVKSRAVAR